MFNKEQQKILIITTIILVIGIGYSIYNIYFQMPSDKIEITATPQNELQPSADIITDAKIVIHLAGAVARPGVYEVSANMRVMDALKIAGGALPEADLDKVNLAEKVKDGKRIFLPIKKSLQAKYSKLSTTQSSQITPVDINTVTQKELEAIPGIGASMARRIIEYRNANGQFKDIDDLMKVKGIKAKKINQIREYLK